MTTNGTDKNHFGKWLRESRNNRGLSMEALAEIAGTAQAVISNLERGTRKPSRNMVTRLAKALFIDKSNTAQLERFVSGALESAGFLSEVMPKHAPLGNVNNDPNYLESVDVMVEETLSMCSVEERLTVKAMLYALAAQKRKAADLETPPLESTYKH